MIASTRLWRSSPPRPLLITRAWLAEQAHGLGIGGWVRNRADGSVEAVVQGQSEMVEAIIERARRGPPASRVADVVISDDATGERLEGFATRPTL